MATAQDTDDYETESGILIGKEDLENFVLAEITKLREKNQRADSAKICKALNKTHGLNQSMFETTLDCMLKQEKIKDTPHSGRESLQIQPVFNEAEEIRSEEISSEEVKERQGRPSPQWNIADSNIQTKHAADKWKVHTMSKSQNQGSEWRKNIDEKGFPLKQPLETANRFSCLDTLTTEECSTQLPNDREYSAVVDSRGFPRTTSNAGDKLEKGSITAQLNISIRLRVPNAYQLSTLVTRVPLMFVKAILLHPYMTVKQKMK
eukprot:gene204-9837_t